MREFISRFMGNLSGTWRNPSENYGDISFRTLGKSQEKYYFWKPLSVFWRQFWKNLSKASEVIFTEFCENPYQELVWVFSGFLENLSQHSEVKDSSQDCGKILLSGPVMSYRLLRVTYWLTRTLLRSKKKLFNLSTKRRFFEGEQFYQSSTNLVRSHKHKYSLCGDSISLRSTCKNV